VQRCGGRVQRAASLQPPPHGVAANIPEAPSVYPLVAYVVEANRLPGVADVPASGGREALLPLVLAVGRGDQEAFARLYWTYLRMVHAIVLGRVPRRDVDDLVQDVFLAAYTRIRELRDPAAFGGWLAAIARNRATDYLRRAPLEVEIPDDLPGGDPIDAETVAVLDAIRKLPEAYRETLLMRLVEGMSGQDIAARTGLTPASVRVNLHRGMKMLREKLELQIRP
jgi:RNA polymerase sigma-70 factor, ECF subfamily